MNVGLGPGSGFKMRPLYNSVLVCRQGPTRGDCSVQFIYASRPSTEYFIRNTGTGSDGRSCHLRHCPHKFTQDNKIQMKHHSKNATKNMHSKDSYSAVNSLHINTFWKHFHCQKSIPNRIRKHCFHTGKLCKTLTT